MHRLRIYLHKEELQALRNAAARSGRSVTQVVREAIRNSVLKPDAEGPVALWDRQPRRTSLEHDSVHSDS